MNVVITQNYCFCCGPMSQSNIRSVVPSTLLVVSFILLFMDIVHLAGVPISGIVVFNSYPIIELLIQIIIISYSLFLIWYFFFIIILSNFL